MTPSNRSITTSFGITVEKTFIAAHHRHLDEIRDIPLFTALADGDARRLSVHCVWRSVAENELIIDYEDETAEVLFVVDGRVRIPVAHRLGP